MKRNLAISLALTMCMTNLGCDPAPTLNQTPPTEASLPVATTTENVTASPSPQNVVTEATPAPESEIFALTSALATKNEDSSYTFVVNGTALGNFADYQLFQVIIGSNSVILVQGGVVQTNPASVISSNLAGNRLEFTVKAISPSPSDTVQLAVEKTPGERVNTGQIPLTLN